MTEKENLKNDYLYHFSLAIDASHLQASPPNSVNIKVLNKEKLALVRRSNTITPRMAVIQMHTQMGVRRHLYF